MACPFSSTGTWFLANCSWAHMEVHPHSTELGLQQVCAVSEEEGNDVTTIGTLWWHSKSKNCGYKIQGSPYELSHNRRIGILTEATWLVLWLTSQAKPVSSHFDARWVTGSHFNCQTSLTLSKTMHAHCPECDFIHRVVRLACIHTPFAVMSTSVSYMTFRLLQIWLWMSVCKTSLPDVVVPEVYQNITVVYMSSPDLLMIHYL